MRINIELDTDDTNDLLGLAALVAAIGGRAVGNATESMDEQFARLRPLGHYPDERAGGNVRTTGTAASSTAAPAGNTAPTPDADDDTPDPAALAGAPDRDSSGLSWDERIHASSRATIADGTWRRRKNTPDDVYDKVMAELRAAHRPNAPAPAASSATPALSDDDTPPPPTSTAPADTGSPAAAATTAAEDVPPPPASDGPDLSTFPKFVAAVNGKDVPAERKTYTALNELCAMFGVAAFKDMKDKPNDWPMFYDMVGQD